jgi:2'-5' RNA ligase
MVPWLDQILPTTTRTQSTKSTPSPPGTPTLDCVSGPQPTERGTERLFLAIWPSPEAIAHANQAVDRVAEDAERTRVSWKPTDRWHITVLFLGTLPVRHHRRIRQVAARAAARSTPAPLALSGSGIFKNVLWLGLSVSPWLSKLHDEVAELSDERRLFAGHLTIARERRDRAGLRRARDQLAEYNGIPWQPRTLDLVRSELGPTPNYEIVACFPLGG